MKNKLPAILGILGLIFLIGFVSAFFWQRFNKPKASLENKIIVYKTQKKLILYKDNRIFVYDIATGKNTGDKQQVGDCRTPVGKFKIVSIERSDTWSYDFGDGKGPIVGAYGPWFLRFDGKWEGIAIHGTHDETTIGKNDTHGCIRMRNKDVEQLKDLVTVSYPVEVIE